MPIGKSSYAYEHRHTYAELKLSRAFHGIPGMSEYVSAAETVLGLMGTPLNPKIEVMYEHTSLREFKFNFLFAPESESESQQVESICRRLRYHSSPTMSGIASSQGLFMIGPSKIEIDYHTLVNGSWQPNKGSNPTIPRIYEGVIDAIQVNYAPADGVYSTFMNGYPVATELTMSFRETRIIDKDLINQGY